MSDVSKAIYSGDWELHPRKVYEYGQWKLEDFGDLIGVYRDGKFLCVYSSYQIDQLTRCLNSRLLDNTEAE